MIYSKGEPLKKVATDQLVDELFKEIDRYYAAGKTVVRDEAQAADAREWLAGEEDETAMTPERLAALEAAAADEDAPVAPTRLRSTRRSRRSRGGGSAGRRAGALPVAVPRGRGAGSRCVSTARRSEALPARWRYSVPVAVDRGEDSAAKGAGKPGSRRPRLARAIPPRFRATASTVKSPAAPAPQRAWAALPRRVGSRAPRAAATRKRARRLAQRRPPRPQRDRRPARARPPHATRSPQRRGARHDREHRDRRLERRQRRHQPDADRRDRDPEVDAHEERGRDLAAAVGRGDGVEVRLRAEERHAVADAAQQRGREDERQRVRGERRDERDRARRPRGRGRPTGRARAGRCRGPRPAPRTTRAASIAVIAPSSARFDVSSSDPA